MKTGDIYSFQINENVRSCQSLSKLSIWERRCAKETNVLFKKYSQTILFHLIFFGKLRLTQSITFTSKPLTFSHNFSNLILLWEGSSIWWLYRVWSETPNENEPSKLSVPHNIYFSTGRVQDNPATMTTKQEFPLPSVIGDAEEFTTGAKPVLKYQQENMSENDGTKTQKLLSGTLLSS